MWTGRLFRIEFTTEQAEYADRRGDLLGRCGRPVRSGAAHFVGVVR